MSLEFEVPLVSTIFVLMLGIVYFSKPKIRLLENRYFGNMIILSFIECLLSVIAHFITAFNTYDVVVSQYFGVINIINMCVATIFVGIFMSLFLYILFISNEKAAAREKIIRYIYYGFLLVFFITTCFTKIEIIRIGTVTNIRGSTIMLSYAFTFLFILMSIVIAILNRKKLDIRYASAFVICALMIIIYFVTLFLPGIILYDFALAILCYIMYFTIENPDVKMLRQMELAKNQAERANNAKSDFLSSMSHEIRTPLNAIVGFSEDIQSHKDEVSPEVVEDADYIMEASKTLLEIVGNILDINKIESNKMEIVEVNYNFKEEVESLSRIDATRIGEKNINFKINLAPDIPYELIGDKGKVKEIINNLLTNAIKYTNEGEIELNVKCINKDNISNLMISVRDTGKGIKAEDIDKLFTKFERLDVEKNSTTEGTGLGLAITKALVEMMGGKINVQSTFGQGSIFVAQIPQKISQMVNPDQTVQINITPIKQAMEEPAVPVAQPTTQEAPITVQVPKGFDSKKILIVDDNKLNIKVARRALQDFDFEIDECYDGQECLNKVVNGNEYDLILMDIMMPNMSGETALAKLKENPNFNIPTIALTADAVAGAQEKYIGEGFADYIAKPFNKEQIKEKLDVIFDESTKPVEEKPVVSTEPPKPEEQEVISPKDVKPIELVPEPVQEVNTSSTSDIPKYDPTVDRFKGVEAHVFGGENNKKDE